MIQQVAWIIGCGCLLFLSPLTAVASRDEMLSQLGRMEIEAREEVARTMGELSDGHAITLPEALARALRLSPTLRGAQWALRQAGADILQASLVPNPNLYVDVSDCLGSDPYQGFDSAEYDIELTKTLETANKRCRRVQVAQQRSALAAWSEMGTALDICQAVTKAYIDLLVAQEKLPLTEELLRLATEVVEVNRSKQAHADGKDTDTSGVEKVRAEVIVVQNRVKVAEAFTALENARQSLAATWGEVELNFGEALGGLIPTPEVEPLHELLPRLADNPDIARWESERRLAQAQIRNQRALAVPDLNLGAELSIDSVPESYSWTLFAAWDLPICNRNQGNILRSIYDIYKVEEEYRAAYVSIAQKLEDAQEQLLLSALQANLLAQQAVPRAWDAFNAAKQGFEKGTVDYLTLINTQQTLAQTELEALDFYGKAHKARADVDRYIGACMGKIVRRPQGRASHNGASTSPSR